MPFTVCISFIFLLLFTILNTANGSHGFLGQEANQWTVEGHHPLAFDDPRFNATSEAGREEVTWPPEEELLIARSAPPQTTSAWTLIRNFMLVCSLVCFLIALVRMFNLTQPLEGKHSFPAGQNGAEKSNTAIFNESFLCRCLVLLVHGILVMDVVVHRPELLEMQSQWTCSLWLLVVATLGLYLTASLSDPGWASQDIKSKAEPEAQEQLDMNLVETRGMQKRRGAASECDEGSDALQGGKELRWCKSCSLYQPLRTKHCKDCDHCIRTFDHHCPWLGNCVGENNHVLFFWFLLLQVFELAVFFCEGLQGIDVFQPSISLTIGLLAIAMLFFMIICLLGFHVFLMIADITTWEYLSWTRVTYLQDLRKDGGSPFTRSVTSRAAAFCFGPHWCPGPLRQFAKLRYDKDGGIIWEVGEQRSSCWLRVFVHWCRCQAGCARS